MIKIAKIRSVFEPHERVFSSVPHVPGITLGEVSDQYLADGNAVWWVNGGLVKDREFELSDGDFVHITNAPTGPLGPAIVSIIKLAMVAHAFYQIIKSLFPELPDTDGQDTDPYHGFSNTYRPEGEALPVVYGTIRAASPIINQSVLGNTSIPGPDSLTPAQKETLNIMMAVSHGPIDGFGNKRGPASTAADTVNLSAQQLSLQINGVNASNYVGTYDYRTGEFIQEPINGVSGAVNYTQPGTTYSLSQGFPNGTASIPFASGQKAYANRIIESDTTEYVSQFLSTQCDRANVQFLFPSGLYTYSQDNGQYADNERTVQVQYWQTDVTGTAVPSYVTVLEAKTLKTNIPGAVSFDWPFALDNPSSIAGGGGSRGYAALESVTTARLKIDGTGTADADLELLACGNPSDIRTTTGGYTYSTADPNLKFSFMAWVKLDEWTNGWSLDKTPVAWLAHWSREASIGATWNSTAALASNLWAPDPVLDTSNSFGWAVCLAVDPDGIAGGVSDADDPNVVLMLYTWDGAEGVNQSSETGLSNGYMSRFRTASLGPASRFADWTHVGFSYDQATWRADGATSGTSSTGGIATLKAYINGVEFEMDLAPSSENGAALGLGEGGYDRYLYGNTPVDSGSQSPYKGMLHVPMKFYTDNKSALRVGGWNSVTTGGTQPFQKTDVFVGEYAFVADIVPRGVFSTIVNLGDSFGQAPIISVAQLSSYLDDDSLIRLASPLTNTDVVATNFFKNYAYPDADSQAEGCLQIENTGTTVKTSGGPTFIPQTAVTEGAYYMVEVFVSQPTEDDTEDQNSIQVDTITTWESEPYEYPGAAVLSASIEGTDQIATNNPVITALVHGRRIDVWDGQSVENPTFINQWSNNPSWVALDILTNRSYGMGSIFSPTGGYDLMHLPSFIEWASYCDEGVPDAFGNLGFFGLKTNTGGALGEGYIDLYFGQLNSAGSTVQSIPRSWGVGKHMSIVSIEPGLSGDSVTALSQGWITKDDVVGGLNNASNMMEIAAISFKGASGATSFHGWDSYFTVRVKGNREEWLPGEGYNIYPNGVFADQFGVTYLGEASQYEYRARFNGVLNRKNKNGWDEIISIFQTGRAMPVKVGRQIMPVWDRPRDPVALVGQGNIREGTFEISYTDPAGNPNSIEIGILDEDRNYQGQTVLVDYSGAQSSTDFSQINKETIRLSGCTSRSQATRDAVYRLNKYALSLRVAKFELGPDAIHLLPGDRIQVAHDVPKYGVSGRLPANLEILNIHPGGESLFSSWTQQGGSCVISDSSLFELQTHATYNPPVVGYNNGVVLAYAVPTTVSWDQELAGASRINGYERTPTFAAQHVANGDAMYPTPDYDGMFPLAPFDRIDVVAKKVNFSCYFKQPPTGADGGAANSVALVFYRYCGNSGYIRASHGASFKWDGSGDLILDSLIGENTGTSSDFGITTYISPTSPGLPNDWQRVAITYDNAAAQGGGSAAVGDYIQARIFFNYDETLSYSNQPSFLSVDDDGRGNQFLFAGDPTNLELQTSTAYYWLGAKVRGTTSGGKIVHDLTVAPPFYPVDTTSGAGTPGDRGFVLLFDHDTGTSTDPLLMSQQVDINFSGSSSPLVTSRANQPMCFTGFFRRHSASESCSILINIRKGYTQSSDELYTDDGGQVVVAYNGSSWSATNTTAGSGITINSSVAAVRLTDAANDADWVQVNIDVTSSANFTQLGFQVGSNSTSGGNRRFYGWGFRLHGAEGATGSLKVNPYPHQGMLMWGAMYEPDYTGSGDPSSFEEGARIQLDRDVTVTAATPAEVYVRSSFEQDLNLKTDGMEVLPISYSELPNVPGTTSTKPARSWISVARPKKIFPRTGDIYSFGNSGKSTEDFIVDDIKTDPVSLIRTIGCIEYNEAIYDDTSFADIVNDTTDVPGSGDPAPGVGDANPTGEGSSNITFGGLGFDRIRLSATAASYRSSDGYLVPSWYLVWRNTAKIKKLPYKEVRIFSKNDKESSFQYAATVPAGVQSYRYDNLAADSSAVYTFLIQPVSFDGTCLPLERCNTAVAKSVDQGPLPLAPTIAASTNGFKQSYTVQSGNTTRLAAVEARIGGWVISTPAWIVDPNIDRFVSDALLPVPADSVGFTQGIIYARGKTLGGHYGVATKLTGTQDFVDVSSSRQTIAENDYASSVDGALDTNLQITSGVLHWKASSSALGPVYYKLSELDATTARRTVVNAIIQGFQIRHETLADLKFALGSSTGKNWSLEGPMRDDGGNAKVEIEWRWTSGSSITSVDWRTFEPGEVYARKVQFRLKFTRKNAGDDVRLERFTVKCNDVPSVNSTLQAIDGGTF